MKKFFSILLAVAMLVSVMTGCGSSTETTEAEEETENAVEAETEEAEEAEPEDTVQEEEESSPVEETTEEAEEENVEQVEEDPSVGEETEGTMEASDTRINYELPLYENETISIWYPIRQGRAQFPEKDTELAKFWTSTQQELGIDIEWVEVGQIVAEEQYNLMVSSGDMCDLIFEGLSSNSGSAYTGGYDRAIEDDVYLDLSSYLEEYCPNYYYWININEDAHNAAYTDSGAVAVFATINIEESLTNMGLVINAEYLDDTGLEAPDTIDGWTELFAAMKVNGVEFPCYATSSGSILCGYVENAMGATVESEFILDVASDQVVYGPATEETRAYLELAAEYYAAGYIDDSFMSIVSNDSSPFTSGEVGTWEAMGQELSTYQDSFGISVYACPLTTGDGLESGQTLMGSLSSDYVSDLPGMCVSTDCDNLEVVLTFMDWFYSDEGALIANYGWTEGLTYEVLEDGTWQELPFLEETDEATGCSNKGIYTVIGDFGLVYPNISLELADDVQYEAAEMWTEDAEFDDYIYKTLPSALSLTTDESNAVSGSLSDMETVMESQFLKWITGAEELTDDSWNSYIAQLESLGLDECEAAYQAAYERYVSK